MTDGAPSRSVSGFADPQRAYRRAPGTTELLVVRHGSADVMGSQEAIEGQTDAPLTGTGHAQAAAVARRLAPLEPARIFVTTMQRTAQTAAPLAAATGLTPEPLADLREQGLGEYDGAEFERRNAARDPLLLAAFAAQTFDALPGAEPATAFAARVARGLATAVAATGPDRTAVVVTHALVIAELCRQVTGSEPFAFIGAENASLTVVLADAGGHRLRSFNDTAHLAELAGL